MTPRPKKRAKAMTLRAAKQKATTFHSLIVRSRGRCANCGETDYTKLQCAHIRSRKYAATRTDLNNAFALCAGCHYNFGINPHEFTAFTYSQIGKAAYQALREKSERGIVGQTSLMFWRGELERLKAIWAEIEAAA